MVSMLEGILLNRPSCLLNNRHHRLLQNEFWMEQGPRFPSKQPVPIDYMLIAIQANTPFPSPKKPGKFFKF
ncbi:hypothetical protein HanRHA438_Chr10g0478091 [Helianthus annuus]|uniref:Uncharacterized protein n=1 Tax=Helianthus annuus TaxID=4232 RepID=A0A251TR41_HELAN|nr:hypothetical protein HanXRQr2_Chr10g0464331 [Helianthus annuus]KAJ0515504.1 hypothetical protein HanHA300_Chr10g0381231 [Helianthus annuus]KAJ0531686.1 hypothetical protein HanHA89_Chr10g0403691 [Helianthus annuus]KAJ0881798.1 hypothetical protein HanRHA438_Chr10g0478091 [Helianthus annuus]